MTDFHLNLICPLAAEQQLIDTLLTATAHPAFSCQPIYSYGMPAHTLSTPEQVLGRRPQTRIQTLLGPRDLQTVLDAVRQALPGSGIRYWTTPVHAHGELS